MKSQVNDRWTSLHLLALWTITGFSLFSGSCRAAGAQAGATGDAVYQLHGRVLDGRTGKSLSRALVTSLDRRLAAMTDSAGRFSLTVSVPGGASATAGSNTGLGIGAVAGGLPAVRGNIGEVMLTAKKPGYLQPEQPLSLPLDATLAANDVDLTLMPAGVVDGRVSAATADSARGVGVSLLMRQVQDGGYVWLQNGSEVTDSHGEFHFGNLRPGEYTAMTTEWRGEQSGARPMAQPELSITQGYPPVFLGDATNLAAAGKLKVHTGETLRADLHLRRAAYYPVTIPVKAPVPGTPVRVQFMGEGMNTGFALGYNEREGAVRGALPSGSYTLMLAGNGPQPAFALVPLHVGGVPLQTAAVTLAPGPRIPVHVHSEYTGKGKSYPLSLNVTLRPDGDAGTFANGNLLPGGGDEFFIENAQPGRYLVLAQPSYGYVASATCGGIDLLRQSLVLNAGGTAELIDVTLRDDGAELKGTVTVTGGSVPSRSFILLLPTDAGGRFTQSFAGPDGTFSVSNLPPGGYRAFAVGSLAVQIPYRDPEAMRAYDGKGTTFTATGGEQVRVEAPLLDSSEVQVR